MEIQSTEKSPFMLGVGASAGGLKPLQVLLESLPTDAGIAIAVVMHIDPTHESALPEVLQSHTKMRVVQVTKEIPVEPNHVYVIPPDKRLFSSKGALDVADFEEPRGHRVPIDQLFRSLAEDYSERLIGIILSGSGTDGAVGMKAIKEQGGVLIVQAPEEAEFDSMPRAVIASGLVDLVLPVKKMALHVTELAAPERDAGANQEKLEAEEKEVVRAILNYLNSRVGHDFSNYKQSSIHRRVKRRMQVNRISRLPAYLTFLREDRNEARALFNDLLIGVTTFFRDADAWEALSREVVPDIFANKSSTDRVRTWVAGCSSGEEAYSVAMLLLEYAETLEEPPAIQVFASDIGEDGLTHAREGLYTDGIEADISPVRLKRFFSREKGYYRVKKELRETVVFANHDVLRDPPFSKLDLITCRNLLIYLERDMQERVFEIFHYALRPCGYLFLGTSETTGNSNLFRTIEKSSRIHRARERSGEGNHLPALPLTVRTQPRRRETPQRGMREYASEERLHRQMLEDYAPPSVLVDENYHVVHLSESVGHFLMPTAGTLSHDITKLVRPELRFELRSALHSAFREGKPSITKPAYVKFDQKVVPISMIVESNIDRKEAERLALVIFLEKTDAQIVTEENPEVQKGSQNVARLEMELHNARRQLETSEEEAYSTTEELKATNEELQSMNEEYRSTTEELETSREELQSINEELQTVNSELKSKLEEISQAHSDLQNLITATDIGTLFLDRELRIKRYTPRIHNLFNIVPTDIGRPIAHFTPAFDYNDLIPTAEQVLKDLRPQEAEIKGRDKCHYLMRLKPYRTVDDKIDGIIITFVEITERMKAEEALRTSEERYRILLENVREYAIFTMDLDRRITTWNTGAQGIFGYTAAEAMGQLADIIFTDEDRATGAPDREIEIATEDGESPDDRLHLRKDGSTFWASGILAALYDPKKQLRGYAKVLRDNTDRKEAEDNLRHMNESLEERVKTRTKEVRTLASTLTMAEQEERRRISQILHDDLQQLLYSVQMKVVLMLGAAEKDNATALKNRGDEARELINQAIQTTRRLTVDLSPPVLKGEGLTDALHWLISLMEDVHELKVELVAEHAFPIPNQDMRVLLFQIVRELLFNIVKHAQTSQAKVKLTRADEAIQIRVSDHGCGFDVKKAEMEQDGFGLFGVRERLNLFGGRMEIQSAPGQGCEITVTAPIDPKVGPDGQNNHLGSHPE